MVSPALQKNHWEVQADLRVTAGVMPTIPASKCESAHNLISFVLVEAVIAISVPLASSLKLLLKFHSPRSTPMYLCRISEDIEREIYIDVFAL